MNRRRFAFWIGAGLFGLSERLGASSLDQLAALAMRAAGDSSPKTGAVHWSVNENRTWKWFEREHYRDGAWKLTGITTPVNKKTGERYSEQTGYVTDDQVPASLRNAGDKVPKTPTLPLEEHPIEEGPRGKPSPARRARHGRPPSKWLRSLNAEELENWLETIDVPEAGVSGMTFWTHLTRDHSFNAENIEGLDDDQLAKLHAAAHHGY